MTSTDDDLFAKPPRKPRKPKAPTWSMVGGVPMTLPPKPKAKRVKSVSSRPLEADVQRAILDYLNMSPLVAMAQRINSGAVVTRHGSRFVGTAAGTSDIIGMLVGGRFLALEVKRDAKGKVSAEQCDFISMVNDNGGLAMVVWSVEMVEEILSNV